MAILTSKKEIRQDKKVSKLRKLFCKKKKKNRLRVIN